MRSNQTSDCTRGVKLQAVQRRAQALATEMWRATPTRKREIERAAAAIVKEYEMLGVRR